MSKHNHKDIKTCFPDQKNLLNVQYNSRRIITKFYNSANREKI